MSFDIPIKVDPKDSIPKIREFEDALKQAEDRGKKAGETMLRVSGVFGKLAEAIRQEREALDRASRLHDQITRKNQPLVKGFGALAEAIRREEEMLERIHGPVRQYMQDLEVLDALLQKNKISTAEYAAEVANLNRRMGERPEQTKSQFGGVIDAATGALGGPAGAFLGGLAGGGLAGAATQALGLVADAIRNIGEQAARAREHMIQMRDSYIEVSNTARRFADSVRDTNDVLDRQQALAHDLHSNLQTTMGLFDAVRDGTDGMNLSFGEQVRITKSLGEAVQLAGKSIDEAGGVMTRLSFALASGSISGGELRSIMRDIPPLADLWTKSFGMTRKELIALANKGMLDVHRLIDPLIDDAQRLDDAFKGQRRTTAQWREEFRQVFELARGQGKSSIDALREALDKTADSSIDLGERQRMAMELASNAVEKNMFAMLAFQAQMQQSEATGKTFNEVLEDTVSKLGRISGNAERAAKAVEQVNAAWGGTSGTARLFEEIRSRAVSAGRAFLDLTKYGREHAAVAANARRELAILNATFKAGAITVEAYREKKAQLLAAIKGVSSATKTTAKELDDYHKILKEITQPEKDAIQRYNVLNQLLMNGAITLKQYREEMGKVRDTLLEMGRIQASSVTNGIPAPSDPTAGVDLEAYAKNLQRVTMWTETAAGKTAKWHEELDKIREQNRLLAESFGSIGAEIVNMAMEGEFSLDKLAGSIARVAFQLAAIQLGGNWGAALSAFAGGLGGFASGGSGRVPGGPDPLYMPRAANGLSGRIGGVGGTDSKIFMARVTPGEYFEFRTPAQQARKEAARVVPVAAPFTVVVQDSPRQIIAGLQTDPGRREVVQIMRQASRRF